MHLDQTGRELLPDCEAARLTSFADASDRFDAWPTDSWDVIRESGVLGWSIPIEYGGCGLGALSILEGYERLASACTTTAFILSQRDAAVRRIRDCGRADLCRELLRPLACGGRFATVGLSQLTTSRQYGAPALLASHGKSGYELNGVMPWVTGADQADHLIAGAVLEDGTQIMFVLPTDTPGVSVGPPMDLSALCGSRTCEVRCRQVTVDRHWLMAGPVESVVKSGSRGGTGGLETSCLALGLAGASIDYLLAESATRPEIVELVQKLEKTRTRVRGDLQRLAVEGATPAASLELRASANALVLWATQSALTVSKGTGFVHPHPAQRWARQALFFLVWSCPRAAAEATLSHLIGECPI